LNANKKELLTKFRQKGVEEPAKLSHSMHKPSRTKNKKTELIKGHKKENFIAKYDVIREEIKLLWFRGVVVQKYMIIHNIMCALVLK